MNEEKLIPMKQALLSGPFGRGAMFVRDKYLILREAWLFPESVGTLASDQMATHLITRIGKPNTTFVDVGAHIGSIVFEVMRNHAAVRIVAIEAMPDKVEKLRRKFPTVEFHGCAVGESSGEAAFFVHSQRSGYSSLGRPGNPADQSITEIRVPVRRLDELVAFADVDAIKIDVEGAELGVFRGAAGLLQKCRPTVMFESGPQGDDGLGYTKEALYEFLVANGYSVLVPNRVAHDDDGLTLSGFIESHRYPRRTTNYFAIPVQRRIEIRDRARNILKVGRG
jgi:FkbM family methyltransferase